MTARQQNYFQLEAFARQLKGILVRMDIEVDLESLVHIEQTFYDAGYADGHAHGRVHGLIEGRALGREKGFEMWEELGFYEGFARTWKAMIVRYRGAKDDDRAMQHIRHLLELIAQFPRSNPSGSTSAATGDSAISEEDLDIPKLQRQIRSRYKALCSSLGVRPRLQIASEGALPGDSPDHAPTYNQDVEMDNEAENRPRNGSTSPGQQQRVALGSSIPVWKIDKNTGMKRAVTNQDLSF